MFTLETQENVKSLASGLRRELKARDISLSHNQLLDAVAKALGLSSYEALSVKLPPGNKPSRSPSKEPVAIRYPLSNTGQFDFVQTGELFVALGFASVDGTLVDIPGCTAFSTSGKRVPGGQITPDDANETEVNWNAQVTRKDARGIVLYVDEDGIAVPADRLVVAPASMDWRDLMSAVKDETDCLLPLRHTLVREFEAWFIDDVTRWPARATGAAIDKATNSAAQVLGFSLTARERQELVLRMQSRYAR